MVEHLEGAESLGEIPLLPSVLGKFESSSVGGGDKFSRKGVSVRLCSPLALEKYFKILAGVVWCRSGYP